MVSKMAAPGSQALVKEAMTHLKMRKGATLTQIRQQIESNYSGKIDFKKRGLLTTALKGLLEKGQVEKKGANYKLARVTKLKSEEEVEAMGRHHRRRKHHGAVIGRRRRHHRRRRHRRRRSVHRRRRHHRRRKHSRRPHHRRPRR